MKTDQLLLGIPATVTDPATAKPLPPLASRLMRGLTLWQPWAWAIAAGHKRVENRPWSTPKALLDQGVLIAIHAGKKVDEYGLAMLKESFGLVVHAEDLDLGAIVAVVTLKDVVTQSTDPWFFGAYGWVIDELRRIDPIPCRGFQTLWTLPPLVEAAVRKAAGLEVTT